MTAPARLLSLRLHGFKSFAETTLVEFGPGISAVVGPNGSGKSNLADGLRWALGEQGRSLRIRRSEDVVWAGSEKRAAVGMADVALVLDNGDGLLPIDFATIELGRRLFRSGENDYLLNRQRVRLRDIVDLLDAANLADNAFLFIGQGMVDQALALRPEERRPLFEEVAGVRRHERRRRRAEEQLVESEANLARVEDILAELRPQARRLAIQAEQQASRVTAGDELAAAVALAAHARWHEAASTAARAAATRMEARDRARAAMTALTDAEQAAAAVAEELGRRAVLEIERRAAFEADRARLVELRLREQGLTSEREAIERDRERMGRDREAAETALANASRELALPVPERAHDLEATLGDAERALADGLAELATLHAASQARGEQRAALRRAAAARETELETARRRLADAERRATAERAQSDATAERRATLEAAHAGAAAARAAAIEIERASAERRDRARAAVEVAESEQSATARRAAADAEAAELARARLDALRARLDEEEARGIGRAARRRGGRRVDDELSIEPDLRAAVEAALGELARAYVVDEAAIVDLATERGSLVPADVAGPMTSGPDSMARERDRRERSLLDRVAGLGGGPLAVAVRRDATGAAARLLERAVWLPGLADALTMRPELPPGWLAVVRDGSAAVTATTVALGRPESVLERRAEQGRLEPEVERLSTAADASGKRAAAAAAATALARAELEEARVAEVDAAAGRRSAEEAERSASRAVEQVAREAAWLDAQAARLEAQLARERDALARMDRAPFAAGAAADSADAAVAEGAGAGSADLDAASAWEARVVELRARRDRLAVQAGAADATRREAEARRARAEASAALAEERIGSLDRELEATVTRAAGHDRDAAAMAGEIADAERATAADRAALDEVATDGAADRARLAAAEAAVASARDRLRAADDRSRSADVADLEARLGLDAIREGTLVELAGLGERGLRAIGGPVAEPSAKPRTAEPRDVQEPEDPSADEARDLEVALSAIAAKWAAVPPADDPPSAVRLASLRRRYHELGASNPFAVEEYREVRTRLESLETQAADLRGAIDRTRGLIDELNSLIGRQFRATFQALEASFDTRFQQLFGGGFARLSLTDPDDLSATGIEIVARPPGKKAQALAMLSGGERALTAVALLFAMLEVRPVPFCVLDEVDAALDEANVGRFTDALRSLADRTQFIVITHNRGTIEQADALYGVTVGRDSVSRVISLRLDEAREIADQSARRPVDALAG